jgi:ABC-2 type transport system ATP-binding protein
MPVAWHRAAKVPNDKEMHVISLANDVERREDERSATILVRNVTKRYDTVLAVDDLSFDVRPGVVTGFLGENGAGKSTTLRILLGLTSPTAGSASVLGARYADLRDPAASVGAVLETQSYNPTRTGRSHLMALATAAGIAPRRVDEVLDQIGMSAAATRRAGTYSLGMRQRLAIGAALLGDPEVLVLDEPANGLDPRGIVWLRKLLRGFVANDRTVLVSSHALAEMSQLADEVIVLDNGRLVTQTRVTDLTSRARLVRVRSPRSADLVHLLRPRAREVIAEPDADLVRVSGLTTEEIGSIAYEARIPIYELTELTATLEEAFFELTKEER